ncbi:MAG: tetratricopeptide repeat protein [Oligoflexia bacterium]|jgi:tetratricopeptide (TPR) repeat protein
MMHSTEKQIQQLISQKRWTEAEALASSLVSRDSTNADAQYLLGVSQYFQGKLGPTIQSLKGALKVDPRHTDAAICLSVLLNDIGRYDDAQGVFSQANQSVAHPLSRSESVIDKKFAVKHLEIADLYFRYRRYEEAIEEYTKAASLDPTALDIRIRRAKAYSRKGFVTRAMQELEQLKNENSAFLPARIQLGLLHYSQGNTLDAEIEWETVLKLNPGNSEAQAYLEMSRESQRRRN